MTPEMEPEILSKYQKTASGQSINPKAAYEIFTV